MRNWGLHRCLARGDVIARPLRVGGRGGIGWIRWELCVEWLRLGGCQPDRLVAGSREAARGRESRCPAVVRWRRRHGKRRVWCLERSRPGRIAVERRRAGGWGSGRSPAAFIHRTRGVGIARGRRKLPRLPRGGIGLGIRDPAIISRRYRLVCREGDGRRVGRCCRQGGLHWRRHILATAGAADAKCPDEAKAGASTEHRPQNQRQARPSRSNDEILSRGAFGFLRGLCGLLHRRVPGG